MYIFQHDTVIRENVRVLGQSCNAEYHLPFSAYPFRPNPSSPVTSLQNGPHSIKGTSPAIIGVSVKCSFEGEIDEITSCIVTT